MDYSYARRAKLNRLVEAYGIVESSEISREDAVSELNNIRAAGAWFEAENAWKRKVESWLASEARWKLAQNKFSDETYAAARKGWELVKQYVPSLDGEPNFEALSDALQFRYATFAAGVLGLLPPKEVKSKKQEAAELAARSALV